MFLTGLLMVLVMLATIGSGVMMFYTPTKERGPKPLTPRA